MFNCFDDFLHYKALVRQVMNVMISGLEDSQTLLAITNLLRGSHDVRYSEVRLYL